ncbi:LysR family transcriptional regulator [Pseudoduganella sp. R-43]|uniref:LysR family transcriptional regulator n=1 Tax=unclassified Pseudoduganella TaxID=2637179 RepID=UPI003CEC58FE
MNLTSDHVELLLAVLEHGSFSAAARALRRVPSAVSMAVGNLEAELGFELFQRGQRELRPTAAALALVPQAKLVHNQLRQLRTHAVALARGLESTLSIGVAADLDSNSLMAAMSVLARRYPLLDIEVMQAPQDEVLALLRRGRVAVCLAYGGPDVKADEQFLWVGSESLVATISPHHSLAGSVFLQELVNVRQIIVAACEQPMTDKRPLLAAAYWRTDSLPLALQMVELGLGWGNFPLSRITRLLEQGRLTRLHFKNTRNELLLPVHLVWRSATPLGKAARELIELMERPVPEMRD